MVQYNEIFLILVCITFSAKTSAAMAAETGTESQHSVYISKDEKGSKDSRFIKKYHWSRKTPSGNPHTLKKNILDACGVFQPVVG